MSNEEVKRKPGRPRVIRTPGGEDVEPVAADDVADDLANEVEAVGVDDDSRTPGLSVNEDGSIEYKGRRHVREFMTPHGMVVPPASASVGRK